MSISGDTPLNPPLTLNQPIKSKQVTHSFFSSSWFFTTKKSNRVAQKEFQEPISPLSTRSNSPSFSIKEQSSAITTQTSSNSKMSSCYGSIKPHFSLFRRNPTSLNNSHKVIPVNFTDLQISLNAEQENPPPLSSLTRETEVINNPIKKTLTSQEEIQKIRILLFNLKSKEKDLLSQGKEETSQELIDIRTEANALQEELKKLPDPPSAEEGIKLLEESYNEILELESKRAVLENSLENDPKGSLARQITEARLSALDFHQSLLLETLIEDLIPLEDSIELEKEELKEKRSIQTPIEIAFAQAKQKDRSFEISDLDRTSKAFKMLKKGALSKTKAHHDNWIKTLEEKTKLRNKPSTSSSSDSLESLQIIAQRNRKRFEKSFEEHIGKMISLSEKESSISQEPLPADAISDEALQATNFHFESLKETFERELEDPNFKDLHELLFKLYETAHPQKES